MNLEKTCKENKAICEMNFTVDSQTFDRFLSNSLFVRAFMDKYTIESRIGSGATSVVKLAKCKDSGTK